MVPSGVTAAEGGIKRSLPQNEQHDNVDPSPPRKRQATDLVDERAMRDTSPPLSSYDIDEPQLREKSPEELIALVLKLRSTHSRQIAEMEVRCEAVNRQLNDLRDSLASYVESQTAALQTVAKHFHPVQPHRPSPHAPSLDTRRCSVDTSASPQRSSRSFSNSSQAQLSAPEMCSSLAPVLLPATPAPATEIHSMPLSRPSAFPSAQQSSPINSLNPTASEAASQQHSQPPQPSGNGRPPAVQCSNMNTVTEIWREYRYGADGNPAIELLDAQWGSKWRPEPKIRTWYSRRKLIYDKIKELMADGLDEATAVREVESMRRGRSMNWLMRLLQDDRRETKATWKAAAAAATAAKQANKIGAAPSAIGAVISPGAFEYQR
ncbi:hypothetical protein NKR23_g7187 [Pleurostoma richardsiae]|uniref:Transcription activator GCR1-like domain-containing protein n=1 Tax=Pleurostoma richardsiae TaxID=41990 RepID=A0AA38RM32_9PEZI|nr:hypothetical protein NKR23_g7187 [Pleurostoma richardsiae]